MLDQKTYSKKLELTKSYLKASTTISKNTKTMIKRTLNSPSVPHLTKEIILLGLDMDCLDAERAVRLASKALTQVLNDILNS